MRCTFFTIYIALGATLMIRLNHLKNIALLEEKEDLEGALADALVDSEERDGLQVPSDLSSILLKSFTKRS